MTAEPVRAGLVGYGKAGRTLHCPPMLEAGIVIDVVSTSNAERAEQAAEDLPHATVVPNLAGVLAARPDVVVLASPSGVHAEQVTQCLKAGIPVVVDKPIAVNGPQAGQLVDLSESLGVGLTVFQNRRYDADQRTLKSLLDKGELGKVMRIERRWERFRPTPQQRWREQLPPEQGGGLLLDLASHLIDNVVQCAGPIDSVYAELGSHTTVAEDEVFIAARHVTGVHSHLGVHSLAGAIGPFLRVLGTEGAYLIGSFESEPGAVTGPPDEPGFTGVLVRGPDHEPVPVASVPSAPAEYYREVVAWLTEGAPPPVDPWDAVHTADVIDAARASHAEGRVVTLYEDEEDYYGTT